MNESTTTNRLLAWAQEPLRPQAVVGWMQDMSENDWETLDKGRWLPRAMRSWQTATFEPPALDRDPDETRAYAADVLLHTLVWLACVDQGLARYPQLDRVALEPQRSSPQSPGGPSGRQLPRVMFWRVVRPHNGVLLLEDLPPLPTADEVFAGYQAALVHQTDAMHEQVQNQLRRWHNGGRPGQEGLSRRNVQEQGALALGPTLRQTVRRHEERRILQATLAGGRTDQPGARPRL